MLTLLVFSLFVVTDAESDDANDDSTAGKETYDLREIKRVDHILASLQRKVSYTYYSVLCIPTFY